MKEAAASKPSSRKRAALFSAVFLFAVVGVAWSLDGWLLARLRIIASDTFGNGRSEHPQLFIDGSEELRGYPPQRLAKFLSVPSAQIRVVVCLSLAERHRRYDGDQGPDPRDWVGVVPKLIRVGRQDPDDEVRRQAKAALAAVPIVPAEDVESVLAFVESSPPVDDFPRTHLLSNIVQRHPDRMPRLVAYHLKCMDSSNRNVRSIGFLELRTVAPSKPETLAAFRKFMDAGDPDEFGASAGDWMLDHHPELIDEFMVGNPAQRKLMLDLAAKLILAPKQSTDRYPASEESKKLYQFDERRLRRLDEVALGFLVPDGDANFVTSAFSYLKRRPIDDAVLVPAARAMKGTNRAPALQCLRHRFYPKESAKAGALLSEFIGWLDDGDAELRSAVVDFIYGYNPEWLKEHRIGHEAPIVKAGRMLLDRFPTNQDYRLINILIEAAPTPRDDDVDRISAAACRSMNFVAEGAAKMQGLTSRFCYEADIFDTWLAKNPQQRDRPSVKSFLSLRAELVKKKLLTPAQHAAP